MRLFYLQLLAIALVLIMLFSGCDATHEIVSFCVFEPAKCDTYYSVEQGTWFIYDGQIWEEAVTTCYP